MPLPSLILVGLSPPLGFVILFGSVNRAEGEEERHSE